MLFLEILPIQIFFLQPYFFRLLGRPGCSNKKDFVFVGLVLN
jgi:hypothetical protein